MATAICHMPPMPIEYKKKFNEYMKNYRETHKDNIEASRKKWRDSHKNDVDYIKKKNALSNKYYHEHKNILLNPTRCACGGVVSKLTNSQHSKSKKHIKYIESLKQQPTLQLVVEDLTSS